MQAYLAEDTEKAILLDMLGYDELWVGEHFTAGTEPYPSPLMFMANLLAHAKRTRKQLIAGVQKRRAERTKPNGLSE